MGIGKINHVAKASLGKVNHVVKASVGKVNNATADFVQIAAIGAETTIASGTYNQLTPLVGYDTTNNRLLYVYRQSDHKGRTRVAKIDAAGVITGSDTTGTLSMNYAHSTPSPARNEDACLPMSLLFNPFSELWQFCYIDGTRAWGTTRSQGASYIMAAQTSLNTTGGYNDDITKSVDVYISGASHEDGKMVYDDYSQTILFTWIQKSWSRQPIYSSSANTGDVENKGIRSLIDSGTVTVVEGPSWNHPWISTGTGGSHSDSSTGTADAHSTTCCVAGSIDSVVVAVNQGQNGLIAAARKQTENSPTTGYAADWSAVQEFDSTNVTDIDVAWDESRSKGMLVWRDTSGHGAYNTFSVNSAQTDTSHADWRKITLGSGTGTNGSFHGAATNSPTIIYNPDGGTAPHFVIFYRDDADSDKLKLIRATMSDSDLTVTLASDVEVTDYAVDEANTAISLGTTGTNGSQNMTTAIRKYSCVYVADDTPGIVITYKKSSGNDVMTRRVANLGTNYDQTAG